MSRRGPSIASSVQGFLDLDFADLDLAGRVVVLEGEVALREAALGIDLKSTVVLPLTLMMM